MDTPLLSETAQTRHPELYAEVAADLPEKIGPADAPPASNFQWFYSWAVGLTSPGAVSVALVARANGRRVARALPDDTPVPQEVRSAMAPSAPATLETVPHVNEIAAQTEDGVIQLLVLSGYVKEGKDDYLLVVPVGGDATLPYSYQVADTALFAKGPIAPAALKALQITGAGGAWTYAGLSFVNMTEDEVIELTSKKSFTIMKK